MFAIPLVYDLPSHNKLDPGLPSRASASSGSLRRGEVLTKTGWMSLIESGVQGENWQTWRRLRICRTSRVQGNWGPQVFWARFYRCTCPLGFPVWYQRHGLGAGDRGVSSGVIGFSSGSSTSIGFFVFYLHLELAITCSYHNPTFLFQTRP
jgi:hypothetical protein